MIKIDNFFVSYLYTIEKNFIINIQNIIISYPLIWHSFIENVVKDKKIEAIDDFHILVYKEKFDKRLQRVYDFIIERLSLNYAITENVKNPCFDYITFASDKMLLIFFDYDYWLYLITIKVFKELKINVEQKTYYSRNYNSYIFFLTTIINGVNYNICFNDTTHAYEADDYFLKSADRIIIITTKNINLTSNHFSIIKYHHNYYQFKEELLEFLIFSL